MSKTVRKQTAEGASWDLFRLSKSKDIVDLCPNTIRAFVRDGLPMYRRGKAAFISKTELEDFIRRGIVRTPGLLA